MEFRRVLFRSSLQVIEEQTKTIIPLHDGLIIDQEDDYNRWIIEAFIDQKYKSFLKKMSKNENVILKVKITKESNKPATFQTTIAHITNIDHRKIGRASCRERW